MDPCSGEKKATHDGVVHQHQLASARYVKVPAYNKLTRLCVVIPIVSSTTTFIVASLVYCVVKLVCGYPAHTSENFIFQTHHLVSSHNNTVIYPQILTTHHQLLLLVLVNKDLHSFEKNQAEIPVVVGVKPFETSRDIFNQSVGTQQGSLNLKDSNDF